MYTAPRTQTITRRTIKRVENGLNGLGQIPFDISGATGAFKAILDWISGRSGQLKVTATEFAEGMVRLMYGLEPDCRMPEPGIPIVPGTTTVRFCAGSIAGMIERCRLTEAENSLNTIKQQFTEKTRRDGTTWVYEEGPYVKAWLDQYGNNDFSGLTTKISSARATCGAVGTIPKVCPQGFEWSFTRLQCVPSGSGGGIINPEGGSGISTTVVIGIVAVFALMMFMRR